MLCYEVFHIAVDFLGGGVAAPEPPYTIQGVTESKPIIRRQNISGFHVFTIRI